MRGFPILGHLSVQHRDPSGATSTIICAASPRMSDAWPGESVQSWSACCLLAATMRGCWWLMHRPRMEDQLVEIRGVLRQGRRPQDWMSVNVVPQRPGSANSLSASRRIEASSSSLTVSSRRDSSATLN